MKRTPPPGLRRAPPDPGFTLLELMVAIGVFVLLAVVLVGLLQSSLNTWDAGTARKDVYERAQSLFTLLTRDVQSLYVVDVEDAQDIVYPFFGDADTAGMSRVRFVRGESSLAGGVARMIPRRQSGRIRGGAMALPSAAGSSAPGSVNVFRPDAWEPQLLEVAYLIDPDPAQAVLWRLEQPWNPDARQSLFNDDIFNQRSVIASARGAQVDQGLLCWEVLYWTRNTGSWGGRAPRRGTPISVRNAGPEVRWDATRQYDERFAFYRPVAKDMPLDPVYPELIRITVVLEPLVGERTRTILAAPVDGQSLEIPVASTRNLPPPPNYVRIGREWIAYRAMDGGTLRGTRGVWGTKAMPHAAGEAVRSGFVFSTVIPVPMYRDGKY
jgi:prepilin-type N-terminal cleavage/methylation domain-containing protein